MQRHKCASHARPFVKKKGIRRKECHSTRPAPLKYGGILHRPPFGTEYAILAHRP